MSSPHVSTDSAGTGATNGALLLILTTEADQVRADALAQALLERRLVVCVSCWPVTSRYRWQGRLETASEVQLLLKTEAAQLGALEAAVASLHSYDTPEWLMWPAEASPAYGTWARQQLGETG